MKFYYRNREVLSQVFSNYVDNNWVFPGEWGLADMFEDKECFSKSSLDYKCTTLAYATLSWMLSFQRNRRVLLLGK